MTIFKRYIHKLRHLALIEPYIIVNDDIAPKLKHYIRLLDEIKFEDGAYHTYYGEIKTILNSFTDHWTEVIGEAIKEADRCSHCMNKEELVKMVDKTISMHQEKQADFERNFQPIDSIEKEVFFNIRDKYASFMEQLNILRKKINKLDKQSKVEEFAKQHFPTSLKKKSDIFIFTYNFISYELGSQSVIDRIRISLQEILNRLRNNLRTLQEMSEVNISHLLIRLYEKNKEHLMLSRQDVRSSVELAEVERSMVILKDKIEDSKHIPIQRLQEEYKYFEGKVREFQRIEKTLKKIQAEEEKVREQQKLFHSEKDTIPPAKRKCWEHMDEKFREKLNEIDELKLKATNVMLSFFSVRGPDRILYTNNVGTYYMDDFGHQCYVIEYGLKNCHVNCEGNFVKVHDKDPYFYDNMGRFTINKSGEKSYQIAPCSSMYKIENDCFVKTSKDCGHSEELKRECKMTIKDPTDDIKLLDVKPVDIKGKLDSETVNYLWETFGHVLPEVLRDVAESNTKNPIHQLAHKLLSYKLKSKNELLQKKHEAIMYREKIHKDRIEEMNEKHKTWKAKQVKRRKPEEIDDAEERFAYNTHMLQQVFVRSLENYDP